MDIKTHFAEYADSFLRGEIEFDRNIKLKKEHTFRVVELAEKIIESENLLPETAEVTVAAALLHDYGRFEQYRQFNTFRDIESVNHGELGAELVEAHGLLDGFNTEAQNVIFSAVRFHNSRTLPAELLERALIPLNMVRDADKLDIVELVLEYHMKQLDNPTVTLGLSPERRFSEKVFYAVTHGTNPLYGELETFYDFAAAKISWFYDLNFQWSRQYYLDKKFADTLFEFIHEIDGSTEIYNCFLQHIGGKNGSRST